MSKLPIHRAAKPRVKDKISRGLKELPQVEIIRPWRGYPVGAIIRPTGVLRQVLMQQGIGKMVEDAEPVKESKPKPKPKPKVKPVPVEEVAKANTPPADEATEEKPED